MWGVSFCSIVDRRKSKLSTENQIDANRIQKPHKYDEPFTTTCANLKHQTRRRRPQQRGFVCSGFKRKPLADAVRGRPAEEVDARRWARGGEQLRWNESDLGSAGRSRESGAAGGQKVAGTDHGGTAHGKGAEKVAGVGTVGTDGNQMKDEQECQPALDRERPLKLKPPLEQAYYNECQRRAGRPRRPFLC